MDEYLQSLSKDVGFEIDQLKYVLCLLAAYPLAFIHSCLPNVPALKHLYSGGLGFAMGYFCFGNDIIHSVITSLVTYLIVCFVPGSLAPKLVFVITLLHLSISHIIRQMEDYGGYTLDYTGPQMILIIKLTSFAYNVYDGSRTDPISEDLKSRAITKIPNPLEFFGFVYFFGGFLAGPAIEIREYLEFTNLTLFPKDKNGKHYIPSTLLPSLKVFLGTLVCFGGVIVKGHFPVFHATTNEFFESTFWYRYFYIQLSVSLQRLQYYFIWMMAEGACVLAGLGYNGTRDGKTKWDRCSNVDIWGVETAQNFKGITDCWNKKTNIWLKNYIYLRVTPPNGKPTNFATFATYLTSAFWHGFYPGYYFTFFTGAIMTTLARSLRTKVRPLFMKDEKNPKGSKIFYDILSWIVTFSSLNYICSSFVLLDFNYFNRVYTSIFYLNHVGALLVFIGLKFLKNPKPRDAASKPKAS